MTYGKNKFKHFIFRVFLTSLCKSDDYKYDDYNYDEYNYDRNYDYTDDDYYGNQNLLAPALPPPFIPPPPSPPMDFNSCINNWCHHNGTMGQYTRCKRVSNNGRTCHNPEIKYGSTIGKPGGVLHGAYGAKGTALSQWCKQLFPTSLFGTVIYEVTYLAVFFLF